MAGPRLSLAGSRRRRSPPDRRAPRVVAGRAGARRRTGGPLRPRPAAFVVAGAPGASETQGGPPLSNPVRGVEAPPRAAFRGRAFRYAPPQAPVPGRLAPAPFPGRLCLDGSVLAALSWRVSQPSVAAGLSGGSSSGGPAASASGAGLKHGGARRARRGCAERRIATGRRRRRRDRPKPPAPSPRRRPDRFETTSAGTTAAFPGAIRPGGLVRRRQSQSWSIGISGRSAGGIGWSRSADGLTQASFWPSRPWATPCHRRQT